MNTIETMAAAALDFEKASAVANFRLYRGIEYFQPRQWQARCASDTQRALPAIGRAQVVIRPGRDRHVVFGEIEI
jgi:hypothetical protein